MIGWLDLAAGASGDMLLGALLDAGGNLDELRAGLSTLPVAPFRVDAETVERGGIGATLVTVHADPGGAARSWGELRALLTTAALPEPVTRWPPGRSEAGPRLAR